MEHDGYYFDRVIAANDPDTGEEAGLRLADHTPHGGYVALVEAADREGVDLTEYDDGDDVGVAVLDDEGEVHYFTEGHGLSAFPIVAEDVGSEEDAGFNVKLDRRYHVTEVRPIAEDAAVEAIEDAYNWFPTTEMNQAFDEHEVVGVVVVSDRDYLETACLT